MGCYCGLITNNNCKVKIRAAQPALFMIIVIKPILILKNVSAVFRRSLNTWMAMQTRVVQTLFNPANRIVGQILIRFFPEVRRVVQKEAKRMVEVVLIPGISLLVHQHVSIIYD